MYRQRTASTEKGKKKFYLHRIDEKLVYNVNLNGYLSFLDKLNISLFILNALTL